MMYPIQVRIWDWAIEQQSTCINSQTVSEGTQKRSPLNLVQLLDLGQNPIDIQRLRRYN